MKIAIVTTWFERGAAYVSRQYRDLLAPRHDVVIYARGGEVSARKNPRWNGSDVTWARSTATHGNTAFHLGHFRRWLRNESPDLVLFNEQQWWAPVLLCRDLGIRAAAYVDYYTEETVPLFANYDLLLCPIAASAAHRHDQTGERADRTVTVNGHEIPTIDQLFWAGWSCGVYLPGTVAPAGLTAAGLPCGLQIVAGHLRDREALAFAAFMERELGGALVPPGYEA